MPCSWSEVSLLLRRPLLSSDDLVYVRAAADAGLLFIDQVRSLSRPVHHI